MIGLRGGGRDTTIRLLDARFVDFRAHFAVQPVATAEVAAGPFIDAIKRVSLVTERHTPVRLAFGRDEVVIEGGAADQARAAARLGCALSGDPVSTAFNPAFLLDALGAVRAETARLGFTQGAARALITDGDYRCVLMPVRLAA